MSPIGDPTAATCCVGDVIKDAACANRRYLRLRAACWRMSYGVQGWPQLARYYKDMPVSSRGTDSVWT
jgi:hypothetical protein